MDFSLSLSSDWPNLVSIPLIFFTIKDLIPKWKGIWDNHLTSDDRRMILRIVMFLALPLVVLIHELGHLFAALHVGAKVYEFHYGPVAGHVTVDSNLAPEKLLWIAVAGNLAQVMVGAVSLILALVVRSVALTVFLVYLGLFAIGDTVIFYAILSFVSEWGDWKNIYQSPCENWLFYVGLVHGMLIATVIYCINGSTPRLWFAKKTRPEWNAAHTKIEEAAKADPNIVNLITLANSFLQADLVKEAQKSLNQAEKEEPGNPGIQYTRAELELTRNNTDGALVAFQKLIDNENVDNQLRARVLLQMGDLWMFRRDSKKALEFFESAAMLDSEQGDSHLQRAMLKANMPNYTDLDYDISVLKSPNTKWIYRHNQEQAPKELEKLEAMAAQRRQEKRV